MARMGDIMIDLTLWPRGHALEGRPINPNTVPWPSYNVHIHLEIADAELLLAFYRRHTGQYETNAANALDQALTDWRNQVNADL